ncbi:hypothetical protein L226DRAFT_489856 [Lentinus tigrinus ALCF2SS1-7]|uniref:Uncharacterized protein n=1 Tax=Lentinus tigrinus ALCF2SS1-6 TaxID=1328759 RepID=A0A5C2S4S3_9APHY|nr:hypothetical protein L227DRAFT_576987 [Lentinus tigrinus ALCF2SS1-6]RPD72759.1 hypothetical protein L226DRAFT_489856 [Lentinus tigrinus ALCF2SS1-7]
MSDEEVFPLPRAEIIALFLESLIFGAFSVLYAIAIWILLYREKVRTRASLNKMLFATSTVMYILSVAHLCLDVQRAVVGFVNEGGKPDGTLEFYLRLNNPTHIAKNVIFITMTLVGDGFVSYRLWIVWNRAWWIVILPILLLTGTAISGYGACFEFTLIDSGTAIFQSNLQPWITSFFALSLTTNLLATFLITARIMWSNRKVRQYRAGTAATSQWDVIETLIQSAAIYSAALASLLGTYAAGSNAQYVCLDALQPLIGLVFTLIIIRVGLGYSLNESSGAQVISDRHVRNQELSHGDYQLRPMAINVSVSRTDDRQSLELYDRKEPGDIESADTVTGTAA